MAEAVVSFVLERVGDFATQEAKFLSGVSHQVEVAQTELQLMQGFLKDAHVKQGQDAIVQFWVAKTRDAAYDLEDVIETYGLKVASKKKRGIKNILRRFACIIIFYLLCDCMSLNSVISIYCGKFYVPTELWFRSPLYRPWSCKTQKTGGRRAKVELDKSDRTLFISCTLV
ncbi:unnamed protein product [Prunus armeniaca]